MDVGIPFGRTFFYRKTEMHPSIPVHILIRIAVQVINILLREPPIEQRPIHKMRQKICACP